MLCWCHVVQSPSLSWLPKTNSEEYSRLIKRGWRTDVTMYTCFGRVLSFVTNLVMSWFSCEEIVLAVLYLLTTLHWLLCCTYWAGLSLVSAYLTFLWFPVSPVGKELCARYLSSQSAESSGGPASRSQGSTYFSFRPCETTGFSRKRQFGRVWFPADRPRSYQ